MRWILLIIGIYFAIICKSVCCGVFSGLFVLIPLFLLFGKEIVWFTGLVGMVWRWRFSSL